MLDKSVARETLLSEIVQICLLIFLYQRFKLIIINIYLIRLHSENAFAVLGAFQASVFRRVVHISNCRCLNYNGEFSNQCIIRWLSRLIILTQFLNYLLNIMYVRFQHRFVMVACDVLKCMFLKTTKFIKKVSPESVRFYFKIINLKVNKMDIKKILRPSLSIVQH